MRRICFIVLILSELCFSVPVLATNYYVDFAGGNDDNSGLSAGSAWKHSPGDDSAAEIPAAASLQPGDVVRFKGGVRYYGTVNIKWSGTAGNRITYDGNSDGVWGTGKAIIDGEGETLGLDARLYGFIAESIYDGNLTHGGRVAQAHIMINNFEVTNLKHMDSASPVGIIFYGGSSTLGTDIEIKNCNLYNIKKKAVVIDIQQGNTSLTESSFADDGQDFTGYAGTAGITATHSITIGWPGPYGDYNNARGYIGPLNGDIHQIFVYKDINLTQPGWTFSPDFSPIGQSGYFYWIYNLRNGSDIGGGIGIQAMSYSNVSIHDNSIKDAFAGIAYLSTSSMPSPADVSIYNNDVSNVNWGINPASGDGDLVGLDIYNNTIHDFSDYLESGVYWGWHTDGVFLFNAGTTTKIKNVSFYNNFFYGSIGTATALLYLSTSSSMENVKIYNNVFASSAGGGYQLRTAGNITNALIYNNVFFHIPGEEKALTTFSGGSNLTSRNNIFYYMTGYGITYNVDNSPGFSSDYNLLPGYAGSTASPILVGGIGYTTESWVNASLPFAHDKNSILFADPLFKSVPHHALRTTIEGTPSRAYYTKSTDQHFNQTFVVGDNIEYNYDHTPRQVTQTGTSLFKIGNLALNYLTTDNYLYLTNTTSFFAAVKSDSIIKIDNELIRADMIDQAGKSIFSNQYVSRGQEGTTRANHLAGAEIFLSVSYIDFTPMITGKISNNVQQDKTILDWKEKSSFVYDLSLMSDSPLIDKGTDVSSEIGSLDRAGTTRPQGSGWDIGAYEYAGQFQRADVNQDGCIELSELLAFIIRWKISNADVSLGELISTIAGWKRGC